MRRRSLIITVFCLGEIVFAIQLIIQAQLVISEVNDWNRDPRRKQSVQNDTERRLNCPSDTICCEQTTLATLKTHYESFLKKSRNATYLRSILYPLIVIVISYFMASLMFNSGSFDLIKLITKIKCCNETFIRRMSFMFWCICWLAEIGIAGFVGTMSALAISDFLPKELRNHDFCKNSGQAIKSDLNTVKCFRKLNVCPTAEVQTLIASLLLSFFLIICAVFKIGYRFFLKDDDTERFECPNCCRCSKKERPKDPAIIFVDGGEPGSVMNSVETIKDKPETEPDHDATPAT